MKKDCLTGLRMVSFLMANKFIENDRLGKCRIFLENSKRLNLFPHFHRWKKQQHKTKINIVTPQIAEVFELKIVTLQKMNLENST